MRRTFADILPFLQIAMSSQLTTLVPVFNGTNYQEWSCAMQSFLMSQNQWRCVKPGGTVPKVSSRTIGEGDHAVTEEIGQQEVLDYEVDSEKALGNIRLRLHPTIGYQYNNVIFPASLWGELKEKYGQPGITQAFIEFKGAMDTVIPNGGDPSQALDKIMSHFVRLRDMKFDIPDKIQAMMILSKAPTSMESIVQIFSQWVKNEDEELLPGKVIESMRTSFEAARRTIRPQNQQRAQKLSAVHPANGQPPPFQQQQSQFGPQRGGFQGGRGRGRRGKRGGQKNAQQQLQQAAA